MDIAEVLSFLFMLSLMKLGQARLPSEPLPYLDSPIIQEYSCDNLSLTQNAMMTDLKDYGVVYVPHVCPILRLNHVVPSDGSSLSRTRINPSTRLDLPQLSPHRCRRSHPPPVLPALALPNVDLSSWRQTTGSTLIRVRSISWSDLSLY